MALRVRKIAEIDELNTFLRGGIRGGKDIRRGIFGLDGLTLVFTAPAATVTFVTTPSSSQISLSLPEILSQINGTAGLSGFAKTSNDGRLVVEDPAAAAAVLLDTGTALTSLGFNDNDNARGTITTVGGADLVDEEEFVLDDGTNAAVTFEFDDDGSVVESATLRAVDFTGGDSPETVRDAIRAAIIGAPALTLTPTDLGTASVSLLNSVSGLAGNVAITDTVVDAGFLVSGMEGGGPVAGGTLYGAPGDGAPEIVSVDSTALGGGTYLVTTDE